ncbi:hypothetical protein SSBR45G_01960 [Bradyrhizobium sp. SSBR45G]|uniref:hypothetical protein n=1 Tax=unclassified Bradyrhizobium TaxID=2631580 RepID=UPI0023428C55|nr:MULTISPECIES: hypothetical protein [unclassified Bradyrhizobium]GLH75288.1 hypothetical protein SSBR45G_01960 [Bradyrhizobium sp. SSBR45G]GLH82925.1 hypothetical protein SSBR45R_03850 [Bradyrhizobium sp. SSBR45R]
MTNLNITLSPTLATVGEGSNLGTGLYNQVGIWVDAILYPDGTFTTIVANGSMAATTVNIPIASITAGKLYLIVWSGASTGTDPIPGLIPQQSDISIDNAQQNNFRFDSIELTLTGSSNDAANLTSVVGFGLPMQLSDANGSVGYAAATAGSGSSIFAAIQSIHPTSTSLVFDFDAGPLSGTPRYAVSPASASQVTVPPFPSGSTPPFSPSDWTSYIATFESTDAAALAMAGFFNGAPDANGIWHNQGFYSYALSYDAKTSTFWLSPASNSQIKGHIRITPAELANSIYATNANVEIYTDKADPLPYTIFGSTSPAMNGGANNQWGNVLKSLFTGFTAGLWGGYGPALNPFVSSAVDLNSNWNWDPSYAFGGHGNPQTMYDPYSKIFFQCSNSYGSGYTDNLMALYQSGGPLLPLGQDGGDVAELNLTVYADTDAAQGYTTPQIYNYIPPPSSGTYQVPPATSGGAINMTLNFTLPASASGTTTWMLDQTAASIELDVLTGYSGSTPQWAPIVLTASAAGADSSLWWVWTVTGSGGSYVASPAPGSQQSPGSLIITGMPVATSGVTWYRVMVSADGASKTFNLYATTAADTSQPQGFGWSVAPGAQAIDGGATIAMGPPSSGGTDIAMTINFLAGASTFIPPALLTMGPQPDGTAIPMLGTPAPPVAGTGSPPLFTAFPGQSLTASSATSNSPVVTFTWTGGAAYLAASLIAYTNKIGALNIARITVSGSGIRTVVTTAADIDGQWFSPPVPLGNGTYAVTMQEFAPDDTRFQSPIGQPSLPLQLTVSAAPPGS